MAKLILDLVHVTIFLLVNNTHYHKIILSYESFDRTHTLLPNRYIFLMSEHWSMLTNKMLQVQVQVTSWPSEPLYYYLYHVIFCFWQECDINAISWQSILIVNVNSVLRTLLFVRSIWHKSGTFKIRHRVMVWDNKLFRSLRLLLIK